MWHLKNKINDRTKQNQTHGEQTDGHQMGGRGGRRATWQAANRHGDVRFGAGGRVGDPGTRRGEPWPGQGRPPAASTNVYPRGRSPGRGLISDANCT